MSIWLVVLVIALLAYSAPDLGDGLGPAVPASQAGAVGLAPLAQATATPSSEGNEPPGGSDRHGLVGICLSTGSASQPFVFLLLPAPAVYAHLAHGDIIARSPADCATTPATPPHRR